MIKKFLMALGVFLVIWAVVDLSLRSHLAKTIFSDIIRLAILAALVGGSIYKLQSWRRYRKDPATREQAAWLAQSYPPKLQRFFFDEKENKDEKP
jgi:hypothetical protein